MYVVAEKLLFEIYLVYKYFMCIRNALSQRHFDALVVHLILEIEWMHIDDRVLFWR